MSCCPSNLILSADAGTNLALINGSSLPGTYARIADTTSLLGLSWPAYFDGVSHYLYRIPNQSTWAYNWALGPVLGNTARGSFRAMFGPNDLASGNVACPELALRKLIVFATLEVDGVEGTGDQNPDAWSLVCDAGRIFLPVCVDSVVSLFAKFQVKLSNHFILVLEGFWGHPQGPNFPPLPEQPYWLYPLNALHTPTLTTPPKVLSNWKVVELKMLDFSDCTRTVFSILTSATDFEILCALRNTCPKKFFKKWNMETMQQPVFMLYSTCSVTEIYFQKKYNSILFCLYLGDTELCRHRQLEVCRN